MVHHQCPTVGESQLGLKGWKGGWGGEDGKVGGEDGKVGGEKERG